MTDAELDKLEVMPTTDGRWAVGPSGDTDYIRDEKRAHLFAAAGMMREAAGRVLALLCVAAPFEETDPDWNLDAHLEITVTVGEARALSVALAAARVPEAQP